MHYESCQHYKIFWTKVLVSVALNLIGLVKLLLKRLNLSDLIDLNLYFSKIHTEKKHKQNLVFLYALTVWGSFLITLLFWSNISCRPGHVEIDRRAINRTSVSIYACDGVHVFFFATKFLSESSLLPCWMTKKNNITV